MKKLFIYYSKGGNGDIVADEYKKNGYEVIKLINKHNLPKNLFMQMMIGGMFSFFHHKASLVKSEFDLSEFEEIVVGTPIWNGLGSTPFNTFVKKNKLNDNVSFVAYAGGGEAPKFEAYINKHYPKSKVIILREPKKNPDELKKLIF